MILLSNMVFSIMAQDVITRETLELISQQTIVTQLVIILVIIIAVGGTIAFFTLRGGIKVFQQLSDNIKTQNELGVSRLAEQEKTRIALEKQTDVYNDFFSGYEARVKNVDDMVKTIYENVYYIKENVVHLSEIITQNPRDYKTLITMLQNLSETSVRAKRETEEIEKVKVNE